MIISFLMILFLCSIGLVSFACESSEESNEKGSSESDDDDNDADLPEEVWNDPDSGLMWQVTSTSGWTNWYSAIDHCESLVYAGYDDWKLPSISQLRSLIRGCQKTQTGGDCGVTDSCVDYTMGCENSACGGCVEYEGPAKNGCYWPDEMNGVNVIGGNYPCGWFWSSSEDPNYSYYSDYEAWTVQFSMGWVERVVKSSSVKYARCVR